MHTEVSARSDFAAAYGWQQGRQIERNITELATFTDVIIIVLLRHQKAATHIHYIVKITEKLHSKKITQYKLKSFPLTMDMATKCFHICSLSLVREAFNEELYQK